MSAALAEAPLPNLADSFKAALNSTPPVPADGEAPPEALATAKAGMDKATEPVKEPAKDAPKEPVKEVAPAKKKSAMDAVLGDDAATEAAPVPDEVQALIESKDPNWDNARATLKRQSEELKTLREQSKKAATPPPELASELKTLRDESAKLKAENDRYRDSIVALDVRYDPAVQDMIGAREKQVSSLAERVKEAGVDPDQFISVMEMPIAKRAKALDALLDGVESTRLRTSIETKLALIEQTDEQIDEKLSNPHQTAEQFKQQREIAAQQQAQKVEQFKQATFDKVARELPKLSKLMRPAPADSEGADEYNATLKADMERAPKLLNVPPEEATVLAFKAARYDSAEKMVVSSRARIAELEAAVAKYEGAEPGFRGNGKTKPVQDWERPIQDVYHEARDAARGH